LCVIKKPRTLGGYSPARGLQNTNPQWVVAPVVKQINIFYFSNEVLQEETATIIVFRYVDLEMCAVQ